MASRAHVEGMVLERSRDALPVVTRSRRTWYRWGHGKVRVLLRDCFYFLIEAVSPLALFISLFFPFFLQAFTEHLLCVIALF